MGFLKKIGRGIKKATSFANKVAKGVASGGIAGGIGAAVTNLGGKKQNAKAQKAVFETKDLLKTAGINVTSTSKDTEQKQTIIKIVLYVLGGFGALFLIGKLLTKRR